MITKKQADNDLDNRVNEALMATRGIHVRTIAVFSSLLLYGFGLVWYASNLNSTIAVNASTIAELKRTDATFIEKLDQSRDIQTRMQAQTDANREKINQLSDIKVVIEGLKGQIELLRKEVSLHSDDVQHILKKSPGATKP